MRDSIRDSPFGLVVRSITKNKYLKYQEELETFKHPYYPSADDEAEKPHPEMSGSSSTVAGEPDQDVERGSDDSEHTIDENIIHQLVTQQTRHELEKKESKPIKPVKTADGYILVDWYTSGRDLLDAALLGKTPDGPPASPQRSDEG